MGDGWQGGFPSTHRAFGLHSSALCLLGSWGIGCGVARELILATALKSRSPQLRLPGPMYASMSTASPARLPGPVSPGGIDWFCPCQAIPWRRRSLPQHGSRGLLPCSCFRGCVGRTRVPRAPGRSGRGGPFKHLHITVTVVPTYPMPDCSEQLEINFKC